MADLTFVLFAVGHLERGRRIDDPIFALTKAEAEQIARDDGGDMAMERWRITTESAERAMCAMADVLRGGSTKEASIVIDLLHHSGVGGEAW